MELEAAREKLEARGARVAAISVDTRDESAELARSFALKFALLSDADLRVAGAYGVAMKGRDIAVPAVFIIEPGGRTIAYRHVGENVADRPSADEIVSRVRALTRRR